MGNGTSEHLSSPLIRSSLQSCNTARQTAIPSTFLPPNSSTCEMAVTIIRPGASEVFGSKLHRCTLLRSQVTKDKRALTREPLDRTSLGPRGLWSKDPEDQRSIGRRFVELRSRMFSPGMISGFRSTVCLLPDHGLVREMGQASILALASP
jgi:hypothetical protein